jgi:hypothetical protein
VKGSGRCRVGDGGRVAMRSGEVGNIGLLGEF